MNFRRALLTIRDNKLIQTFIYSKYLDYHQWALLDFVKKQAIKIKTNEKILDAGAGELKYKKYFNHCKYISNDLCIGDKKWYFSEIDIKSNIYKIPVKNNSFDYILCTQVLEHLEFPSLAFKEFNRILKRGGKLLLTAPLGQGEHQIPYDYFRYTKYALESLGRQFNFELKYIKPHGGIFINLEYILWQAIKSLLPLRSNQFFKLIQDILLIPLKLLSGILFNLLDLLDTKKNYTNNYNCIYVKLK